MANENNIDSNMRKPLRLWPGVTIAIVQWLVWLGIPVVFPEFASVGIIGGAIGGLAILIWWLFFSRAAWMERIGAVVLMVGAVFATKPFVHPSIANGMMGMMLPFYSIPPLSLALVAWAVAGRRLSGWPRQALLVASIMIACGVFTLLRTGGLSGEARSDWHWRWTQTPEERLLTQEKQDPVMQPEPETTPALPAIENPSPTPTLTPTPTAPTAEPRAAWPGFRGPNRDGIVRGARIGIDWAKSPPVEVWRRQIGPGWSSFAVRGDLIYTQEQRGNDEVVSCYNMATGEPVWRHRDQARFWESNAGAGPRATPTLGNGRVYAFGATGILNALDARTGKIIWSRNAQADTEVKLPGWGFASSPLLVNDLVIVAVSGRLAAYDAGTGKLKWLGQAREGGYSSPHLMTIDGVTQVLLLNGNGATSVAPADGSPLWEHAWSGTPILQPARAPNGDLLITAADMSGGIGIRRLAVSRGEKGWTVEERWTTTGLKPYFNDFVVHKGHAYGFDGSILACIDLENGKRKWKGGRYGHGQFVLLPDQDLLLVLSEDGELALVSATPDKFAEVATKIPAIEGKTWNHPVLVGDLLLVRNGEQMAAFRMPVVNQ